MARRKKKDDKALILFGAGAVGLMALIGGTKGTPPAPMPEEVEGNVTDFLVEQLNVAWTNFLKNGGAYTRDLLDPVLPGRQFTPNERAQVGLINDLAQPPLSDIQTDGNLDPSNPTPVLIAMSIAFTELMEKMEGKELVDQDKAEDNFQEFMRMVQTILTKSQFTGPASYGANSGPLDTDTASLIEHHAHWMQVAAG